MSRFENLEFDGGREQAEVPVLQGDARSVRLAGEAFEAGRFEEALRHYAKALEFNPRLAQAWTGQVRMLIELREFKEARVWAEKALAAFPDEPELLAAKGVALARCGDLDGAISFSDAAVESQGNTPYIWLARADVLLARKEKRAEYCFEKALALAGKNWVVLWLAARIQEFYGHFARALKVAQEALTLEPARAVLWLETGQCQLALGLAAQARNSFEQARELDPDANIQTGLNEANDTGFLRRMAGHCRHWLSKS